MTSQPKEAMTLARTHTGWLAVLAVSVLTVSGCGGDASDSSAGSDSAFPTTLRSCGEEITVSQRPERIMTVGNVAVEHVVAAGGADLITVRAGPHDGPLTDAAASAVADVQVLDQDDPSTETVIGAEVDMVISYGLSNTDGLAEAGIPSIVVASQCADAAGTYQEILDEVERYGALFGSEDDAAASVAAMQDTVNAAQADAEGAPGLSAASVYFFGDVLTTNGASHISNAWMDPLGLTNIFADVEASFTEGNLEELIDRDPGVLILSYGWIDGAETFEEAKQKLLDLPGAADMPAVQDDRIVGIPSSLAQNDPASFTALETIAEGLGRTQ